MKSEETEVRDLKSLLKSLYDSLYKNAMMMSALVVRADDKDEAAQRRLDQFKRDQQVLAEKIYNAQERLGELGEVLELRPPLGRFAQRQQGWILSVGRPQ